jgi:hypothetical protein
MWLVRAWLVQVRLGAMVAPMVGSMMLVGGSRIGELDAAFDELSRSVGFGGSPPNKLCFAPASFLDQSRVYSFGSSKGDVSDGSALTGPTWVAASGPAEPYALLPSIRTTQQSDAPLFSHPKFSLAAAGGWISENIQPAGIGDFGTAGAGRAFVERGGERRSNQDHGDEDRARKDNAHKDQIPFGANRAVAGTFPLQWLLSAAESDGD